MTHIGRLHVVRSTALTLLFAIGAACAQAPESSGGWTGARADGSQITAEELRHLLKEHELWLNSAGKYGRRADLIRADLRGADLERAPLSKALLRGANLERAYLADADLSGARLESANLRYATLANANLSKAVLWLSNMTSVDLQGANLAEADIWRANVDDALFEPANVHNLSIDGARNFQTVRMVHSRGPVLQLRRVAKDEALREQERALTAAIRRSSFDYSSRWLMLEVALLDFPSDSGAQPWRALLLLLGAIPAFSILYFIALVRSAKDGDGIWQVWPSTRVRKDLGTTEPNLLTLAPTRAPMLALAFSLAMAFRIGWRELNLGYWIQILQTKEYTLQATGWVRTVAGIQSLTSLYLLATFALTYFGRPFE